jgi:hypothetical protein
MKLTYIRRTLLQIALVAAVGRISTAGAKVRFGESQVRGPGEEVLCCDLDGDRLKDIVLRDEQSLLIFYQDAEKGFGGKPSQVCDLGGRPAIVWPAKLGKDAESLLLMTCDGVTELDFTKRGEPAIRKQIITQQTILPESSEEPASAYVPLSPRMEDQPPVILLPAGRDLQVWRRTDTWQCVQTLKDALETTISASRGDLGYDRMARLTLSLGDLTSDDILVRTSHIPMSRYAVYAQNPDGLFSTDPAFTWTGPWDWSWYCWVDLNRDGRVDLIKGTLPGDPWFLAGILAGKVLVQIYTADEHGQIPAEPQQVFRKNDWIDSVPIVDVDGDGYLDLVLGYSPFSSREGYRKVFSAKQIDFDLGFHFYRPGAGFPEKPDFDTSLLIHIDYRSVDLSLPRHQFFKTFVNLHGDFNSDGRRDLLIRDRADRISAYPFLSRQAGFAKTTDVWFPYADPIDRLQVEDLNGDHISDLIMKLNRKDTFRVFLSHGP